MSDPLHIASFCGLLMFECALIMYLLRMPEIMWYMIQYSGYNHYRSNSKIHSFLNAIKDSKWNSDMNTLAKDVINSTRLFPVQCWKVYLVGSVSIACETGYYWHSCSGQLHSLHYTIYTSCIPSVKMQLTLTVGSTLLDIFARHRPR